MEFLQILAVGTRTHIKAVYPRTTHQLYQILVKDTPDSRLYESLENESIIEGFRSLKDGSEYLPVLRMEQ